MNKIWKAVLGVVLIYLFGCLSGVVCTSIFVHNKVLEIMQHPGLAAEKALEKRLTGNLRLDPGQRAQIDGFFLDNLQQRKELQKQIHPQVQSLNGQTVAQVLAILRPDQKDIFHQNIDTFRAHLGANAFTPDVDNLFSPQAQPPPPTPPSPPPPPPGQ